MAKKILKAKAAKMKATGRAKMGSTKSTVKASARKAVASKKKAKPPKTLAKKSLAKKVTPKKVIPNKKSVTKKTTSKKSVAKKSAAEKISNRRKSRRYPTPSLWVTEHSGDYQFTANASDISEGGIFLKARVKTTSDVSQLTLHLGNQGSLELLAKPIHDRIAGDSYGAGYEFTDMSSAQIKTLRGFLRNLD